MLGGGGGGGAPKSVGCCKNLLMLFSPVINESFNILIYRKIKNRFLLFYRNRLSYKKLF